MMVTLRVNAIKLLEQIGSLFVGSVIIIKLT